ncbi:MAG: O-methyltransferase [Anaerolineales bacterium]|nr:O-methyltransferase [Anaerolineales bacterium]
MTIETWSQVDNYLEELFVTPDPVLAAALKDAAEAGLPAIQITPIQGKLLGMLARTVRARRILEIGTLGGYSTIWLARALPAGGRLITLEVNPVHAGVARKNLQRAGLDGAVEVRLGPAQDSLQKMVDQRVEPFDLVFIDGDKPNYPDYLRLAVKLSHPGSLIVADNVIRGGKVADEHNQDENVRAMRDFNAALAGEKRLMATEIQTVGRKNYDGFALALVIEDGR